MNNGLSPNPVIESAEKSMKAYLSGLSYLATASQTGISALFRYTSEFVVPYMIATNYFRDVELGKLGRHDVLETLKDYMNLGLFNLDLSNRAVIGALGAASSYARLESAKTTEALLPLFFSGDRSGLDNLVRRKTELLELIAHRYPEAIQAIEPEYGFHFERGMNPKVAETDRFIVYQVLPTDANASVRSGGKPILILPPYVLGGNILGFLPGENRSYAHCFANQASRPTFACSKTSRRPRRCR